MLHDGSVAAKVFLGFLKRLMIGAHRPVFVIVDGHPAHKVELSKMFIKGQGGKLKLFYLPPYSQHLNPGETAWTYVKRKLSCQLAEKKMP